MKSKILIFIVSILLINCRGQEKETENKQDKVSFINSTFLGVNKTDSLYTVYNRCDGGYPVLRFTGNGFYFYSPQEGINYVIKEIKSKKDKYVITTSGYYFLKGETILKQNDVWYFEKQDNLLWSFKNKNWDKVAILSDSANIAKKKIAYRVQPCRECSDECKDESSDTNLLGTWNVNCENPIGITIKDNELIMTVEPNQYYIHLIKINDKTEKNVTKYKLKSLEGQGSKDVYSEVYFNDKEVAIVKNLGNNKIEFNWLGFYNKVNKQRQYTEPLISNDNPVIMSKCGK